MQGYACQRKNMSLAHYRAVTKCKNVFSFCFFMCAVSVKFAVIVTSHSVDFRTPIFHLLSSSFWGGGEMRLP